MTAPVEDRFDEVARLVRDRKLSLGIPYPRDVTPKEHQEKVENARKAHLEALARFMREGGEAQEFFKETFHLHGGGSTNLLPLDLALKFRSVGTLTAQECWAFVMCWQKSPGEKWPGRVLQSPAPLPEDDEILKTALAMMDEEGLTRDEVAKRIRSRRGFEGVGNEHARRVMTGVRKRGRPTKKPAG